MSCSRRRQADAAEDAAGCSSSPSRAGGRPSGWRCSLRVAGYRLCDTSMTGSPRSSSSWPSSSSSGKRSRAAGAARTSWSEELQRGGGHGSWPACCALQMGAENDGPHLLWGLVHAAGDLSCLLRSDPPLARRRCVRQSILGGRCCLLLCACLRAAWGGGPGMGSMLHVSADVSESNAVLPAPQDARAGAPPPVHATAGRHGCRVLAFWASPGMSD